MQNHDVLGRQMTRRLLLGAAGMGGLTLLPAPAWAEETVDLRVPGGPSTRPITTAYPQKGRMILQRTSLHRAELRASHRIAGQDRRSLAQAVAFDHIGSGGLPPRRLRKKHPEIAELLRENCGLLWRFN
jgi:hypothetical protein